MSQEQRDTPQHSLTREQIESWRRWYHTGATHENHSGSFNQLCDMALSAESETREPVKWHTCRAPSATMTISSFGEWCCNCGASSKEPECRYLRSPSSAELHTDQMHPPEGYAAPQEKTEGGRGDKGPGLTPHPETTVDRGEAPAVAAPLDDKPSATPRTDACMEAHPFTADMRDLARQLERELAECRQILAGEHDAHMECHRKLETAQSAMGAPDAWIWHYTDGRRSLRWRPDHDPVSSDVPDHVTPLYVHGERKP